MFHSHPKSWANSHPQRRRFERFNINCRARIRIGNRQYAGFLHNISRGGAKLRTISPINRPGNVILRLPDLPPLRCRLRWADDHHAGVSFELPLPASVLSAWTEERSALIDLSDETAGASDQDAQ